MNVTQSVRRDVAADINAKILALLAEGVMPWRKPWDSARVSPALPRRVGGEPYRGANVILLWSRGAASGFRSPYWLTFKQANKLGASVRKGEHGESVIYYGAATRVRARQNKEAVEDTFRFLKSYVVFNADQIDGLDAKFHAEPLPTTPPRLSAHDKWFLRLGIARILSRDVAAYVPKRDLIAMPSIAAFDSVPDYCATLNHECVHATGAAHRVGRDLAKRFSHEERAVEELIAEIGAALLGAHMHLPQHHILDHAAYIGSWMRVLANDTRAFLYAAGQAQRAVDWLLAKSAITELCDVQA